MEKELIKDSTIVKLLNDIEKDIPFYNEYLWNVIKSCKDDKNFPNFKAEYDIVLIFTVVYLDFLVCLKNILSSKLFWESAVAFKNIHKIIFESHNKISFRVYTDNNGAINSKITQKNQTESLWFGKMPTLIEDENKSDYNRISDLLEKFKTNADLKYINKIRNFDGHYSNLDDYLSEIKSIDMEKTIEIATHWFIILREVNRFALIQLNKKRDASQ